MAKNSVTNRTKIKLILILSLVFVICLSVFTFISCGSTETQSDTDSVTKIETDEETIKNGNFEFGSSSITVENFPQVSPSGWSKSADNSASSSSVNSGIVDLHQTSWASLVKKLSSSSAFWTYIKTEYEKLEGIDADYVSIDSMEATIKADEKNKEKTDTEITTLLKEYFIDNGYIDKVFTNPGVNNVAAENKEYKVLMLNNYLSANSGIDGTAQKATSSTSINMSKGTYGKVTVWVNTQNIVDSTIDGYCGANIRIIGKYNSVTQDTFALYGINTEGTWKQYTIYVKADKDFDSTIQVVLGLGFGNGKSTEKADYVKGTVYFDDVVFEEIEQEEYELNVAESTGIDYTSTNSSKINFVNIEDEIISAFDMTVEIPENYFINTDLTTADGYFTKSNVVIDGQNITSQTKLGAENSTVNVTKTTDSLTLDLTNASYTVELEGLELQPKTYALISFDLDNNLSRFDKNGVSVYVKDSDGTLTNLTTIKTLGKTENVNAVIKNNFPEGNQSFSIVLIVGPSDITTIKTADAFSSGSVTISDFKFSEGTISEEEDLFELFSANSVKTVSLFAGYSEDYNKTTNSYSFTVSPSDIGTIVNSPADPSSYIGLDNNSVHIKGEQAGVNYQINANELAGLINTDYIDNYSEDVKNAIADYEGQPLMIYNSELSSYGFIGQNTISIAASSNAKISVKVRVVGNAVANIYLTDISKDVAVVETLKVKSNTDGYNYIDNSGIDEVAKDLYFTVDNDLLDEDGWVTVSFYIATGKTEKKLRLEMWNGGRNGEQSEGYVFFDDVTITTANAFTEPTWTDAFYSTSSVLYNAKIEDDSILNSKILYKRVLTDTEIAFNKEYSDQQVSYDAKIVWANNSTTIYAVYNSLDPVEVNPYDSIEKEEPAQSGCAATTDASTFWLSFSSILLAVVLVLAVIALFIKNIRRRVKANKNDAKSHYKVTRRYTSKKSNEEVTEDTAEEVTEENEISEETPETEEITEEVAEEENEASETTEEYVYGEVTEDFGEDQKPEEPAETSEENKPE